MERKPFPPRIEHDYILGPHQVVKVDEIDLIETPNGVEFIYDFVFMCMYVIRSSWMYSNEDLEEMDEMGIGYNPAVPGDWVEVVLDENGQKKVVRFDPEQKGGGLEPMED